MRLDPLAVTSLIDEIDAATASISRTRTHLGERLTTLGGSWVGAAQTAQSSSHERWSARMERAGADVDGAVADARTAVQRLVKAEEDATAVWL